MSTSSTQHTQGRSHARQQSILTPTRRGGHHESARAVTIEHYTPRRIFEALDTTFDLDPASPGAAHTNVPAALHYALAPRPSDAGDPAGKQTVTGDGLALDWPEDAYIWLNPPYSQPACRNFVERLAHHPAGGIALLFTRTETRWWRETCAAHASSMLFVAGRISFDTVDGPGTQGNAPAPSVLVGFGPRADRDLAVAQANGLGWLVEVVR